MAEQHTPEPWKTVRNNGISVLIGTDANNIIAGPDLLRIIWSDTGSRTDIAYVVPFAAGDNGNYNARRIVACVNACKGMTTEQLEFLGLGGVILAIGSDGVADIGCDMDHAAEAEDARRA